ncbi:MAG: PadR family transcriptional regulator [Bacteroidetes bacterium CG02_land_8_20_14_3_00_31_25]|nr:PadR family transcriptional regulator [Bacteroidota bacterium]OFX30060.1 MAG: PadR family transcriptional regulator [Bacteroidetes bacterium GWA2_32_17]PIV62155.1 MAG: PadR family transcriptional regulator [Bacteroidetes bacterium CG02_land_8_20_14_3_00_31_25]PIX32318.1 MAG: PadR family transcriptional regulator [Bacteroidetes bacterium CG_4_8_14_3_um_filter_31_14]PIY07380.1 MAG: PadR family transcriptional regulator [Bacteroidetes bacterium CG_4_10_14_3_um_filter_31_20]
MNIENTKAQMRKGVLEYCILSVLSNGDAYASDIISKLKKVQLIVVEGTLYPLLNRLKNDGMLSYRWEESLQGPPRKYYKLTSEGEKFLNELHKVWKELVENVAQMNNQFNK